MAGTLIVKVVKKIEDHVKRRTDKKRQTKKQK